MQIIKSFFSWIYFIFAGSRWVFAGFLRLPFGKAGDYYRRIGKLFGPSMLSAVGATATFEGLENLDPNQSYIFAGNHQSYVDIFMIQAAIGTIGMETLFMAKEALFKIPFFGTTARQMGLIPIAPDGSRDRMKILIESIKTLRHGNSLTVFVEGSRSRDGQLQAFKKGAFLLSSQTGLPIAPFVVKGTIDVMSRNDLHIHRGKHCIISFLPPIMPEGRSAKELARLTEEQIHAEYDKLMQV
ncbi:MAG: 1-acyl-sn-glycerol-3-phosphate acyltransferase [Deferribacteraceae bacterium]|jgi:1-acyl-sn-glycerol-3-phosphate acyltransferase|nr:1-acyl-sn-glycerol-3-phosphate acyltransferase [Deferribacteraceae bacterium]